MNLDTIKNEIANHLNKQVLIKVYGMRNKNYEVRGVISGVYPAIFTVNQDGLEKSFSYSDVATKEIIIKYM